MPTLTDDRRYLRRDELHQIAAGFPDFLGYYLEGTPDLLGPTDREPIVEAGWEGYQRELRTLPEVVAVHGLRRPKDRTHRQPPVEFVHCDQEYDPVLLSYFVDGLCAARSRAAFLSFYQVLEHVAGGDRASGGDLASLMRLLQDTERYPDRVLTGVFQHVAAVDGGVGLAGRLRTRKRRFRRDLIAQVLHSETRNPLTHARRGEMISRDNVKSGTETGRAAAIPPFSRLEHATAIEARTVLCRELARVVVAGSGSN